MIYNEQQAQKKVEALLNNYKRYVRIAGKSYEQHLTASYSFEPKSNTNRLSQPIENMVTAKVEAQQILDNIYEAMNSISQNERVMLVDHYLKDKVNDYYIEQVLNFSRATYYNKLKQARVAFAEVFGNGELLNDSLD